MQRTSRVLASGALVLVLSTASHALAGTLRGSVLSAAGQPVSEADVSLPELRLDTTSDDDGRFSFPDVPSGEHYLVAASLRFGSAVVRVDVAGDATAVTVTLDQHIHTGSVSVTATGRLRGLDEVVAPVDVLSDEELARRVEATLGGTLAQQPGVAAGGAGRGSGRPVIRGLAGDRIRVLENGLGSGDVSSIGPDHATSVEPLAAERIEVVRGPATLLYGGTAVGGVVNVLDGRIPDRVPDAAVSGTVQLSASTNSDELGGSLALDGGAGAFAWHLQAFGRDSDDYSSPARRSAAEDPEHEGEEHDGVFETGRVENSFVESRGGALGMSWVGDRGWVGLAASAYDSDYGVPGHSHQHEAQGPSTGRVLAEQDEEHEDEEAVTIDLEQRRLDLHGRLDAPLTGVEAVQLRVGWRDYSHRELEGRDVGTRFANRFVEGRLEALLAPLAGFEGVAGLHWLDRDFSASGAEAYVRPTTTRRLAAFAFEELPPRPWGVQVGMRLESQDTDTVDPALRSRSFTPLSASAGVTYAFSETWRLNLTASHAERAPTAEELYSDGPHAATRSYEVGNPALGVERGNGVDLTARVSGERLSGSASIFLTRFDDYVYLADTGEVEDGLPVRAFTAADAELAGAELHGDLELYHGGSTHLHLEATYDRVRGRLTSTGEHLPRIPPQRLRLGLVALGELWNARLEGRWVDEQDRVADLEEPTPDYAMLDASVGVHFVAGGMAHHLLLRGSNLTDEAAFNHVSFLKRQAPLPGRTVTLLYRAVF